MEKLCVHITSSSSSIAGIERRFSLIVQFYYLIHICHIFLSTETSNTWLHDGRNNRLLLRKLLLLKLLLNKSTTHSTLRIGLHSIRVWFRLGASCNRVQTRGQQSKKHPMEPKIFSFAVANRKELTQHPKSNTMAHSNPFQRHTRSRFQRQQTVRSESRPTHDSVLCCRLRAHREQCIRLVFQLVVMDVMAEL